MTAPEDALDDDDALPEPPPPEGAGFFGAPAAAVAIVASSVIPTVAGAPRLVASYRVLARAYRPLGFDDMIGQDATVRVLRRAFATGRVAHAFMLTGVRGVGKTTTARIIARALTCVGADGTGGPTADPCGVCPNCVAIGADRHPDVLELDAASRTGVDDVREIIEATRFRPMQARAKVFIVDEVHMLSRNAFNALLKTLEEPPDHVTFVFATTELRKVPVTVLSRCQRFDLRRVPQDVLAAHFARIAAREGVAADDDAVRMIARAADGSVRDGLSLLDQAIATAPAAATDGPPAIRADAVAAMLGLADRSRIFDLAEALFAGAAADALAIAGELAARGADPAQVLADLLDVVHVLTRLRTIPALAAGGELPELERVRGGGLAAALAIPVLGRAWQVLLKGIGEIEAAPDRQAAAEMVLIRLCHLASGPTPGELVRRLERASADAAPSPARSSPPPPSSPGPASPRSSSRPSSSDHASFRHASSPGSSSPQALAPQALAPEALPPQALPPQALAPQALAPQPSDARPSGGEGAAATIAAAALARARPVSSPLPALGPTLANWRDVVAAVAATGRDPILLAQLRHAVRPVRVLPGIVEIRPDGTTPRDLAARLSRLLGEITGERWTVALSSEAGDPTIAERGQARRDAEHEAALRDPLVAGMLRHFPGATVAIIRDEAEDEGLAADDPAPTVLGGAVEADADAELTEANREKENDE